MKNILSISIRSGRSTRRQDRFDRVKCANKVWL